MKLLAKDYQFADPSAEKAWIIRTTINACKDHLRTSFWKRVTVLDEDYDIPAPKEPESDLLPLVMELPKNYRISIYLHYYEVLSSENRKIRFPHTLPVAERN